MFRESGGSAFIPVEAQVEQPVNVETTAPEPRSSQFGNKQEILEIIANCPEEEMTFLGNIDEAFPDTVAPHLNIVELIDVPGIPTGIDQENVQPHKHNVEQYVIQHGDQVIRCVFKPLDGENKELKHRTHLQKFYPQEYAAYLVSEALNLDVVPPTTIRTIKSPDGTDRVGALQFFLDHDHYKTWNNYLRSNEPEAIQNTDDYYNIALLDFILANPDRHGENWMMTEATDTTPPRVAAIDNGVALKIRDYSMTYPSALGPSRLLSTQNPEITDEDQLVGTEQPRDVPIPEHLLESLQQHLTNEGLLADQLADLQIPPQEIIYMIQRMHSLAQEKHFLSRHNRTELRLPTETYREILHRNISLLRHDSPKDYPEEAIQEVLSFSDKDFELIAKTSRDELAKHPQYAKSAKAVQIVKFLRHPTLSHPHPR